MGHTRILHPIVYSIHQLRKTTLCNKLKAHTHTQNPLNPLKRFGTSPPPPLRPAHLSPLADSKPPPDVLHRCRTSSPVKRVKWICSRIITDRDTQTALRPPSDRRQTQTHGTHVTVTSDACPLRPGDERRKRRGLGRHVQTGSG